MPVPEFGVVIPRADQLVPASEPDQFLCTVDGELWTRADLDALPAAYRSGSWELLFADGDDG